MNMEVVKVGYLETNCYILSMSESCIVIDPGDDFLKIKEKLGNRRVEGIIITHYHDDHTGALKELADYTHSKIYDIYNLEVGKNKIGKFEFECIRTPGHKEDAISLYFEEQNILFSGDFIFRGTIGRWDFPGGSFKEMVSSIKNILNYSEDMTIYPGHGEKTSLQAEKDNLKNYIKHF